MRDGGKPAARVGLVLTQLTHFHVIIVRVSEKRFWALKPNLPHDFLRKYSDKCLKKGSLVSDSSISSL